MVQSVSEPLTAAGTSSMTGIATRFDRAEKRGAVVGIDGWSQLDGTRPAGPCVCKRRLFGIVDEYRTFRCVEQRQRCENDPALEGGIAGNPERSAEIERHPERARRPNSFAVFADQTDQRGLQAIAFEVMGEHGFVGFFMFMLLAWFTWNTGNRIRRDARGSEETRWAADLANMLQVSLVGYAAAGAFLGLAYFDLYYDLIAMMVICRILLREQIAGKEGVADTQEAGVTVVVEQPDSEKRSLRRGY